MRKKALFAVLFILLAAVLSVKGYHLVRNRIWAERLEKYSLPRIPDEDYFEKSYDSGMHQYIYQAFPSEETDWVNYALYIPDQGQADCYCLVSPVLMDDGEGGTALSETGCLYSVFANIEKGKIPKYIINASAKEGSHFSRSVYEFDLDPEGNIIDADQFSEREISEMNEMLPELNVIMERINHYFHIEST